MSTISDKRFVKTWMESDNAKQVATKLGLSRQTVNARAFGLRKRGVNLPKLAPTRKNYSADELNSLIDSYRAF